MASPPSPVLTAPIAETRQGRVAGLEVEGVQAFRGMPYAAPPTGARRFRPPEPPQPWAGVRDASDYGASCPQVRRGDPDRPPPIWVDDPQVRLDEDCLFLNVWTPGAVRSARRPVIVWVHTGGFGSGSGSAPLFAGDRLARRGDVVVVSFNHRLGALGFLQLEHLDPAFAGSANVGMLDIVAALQWVRDNVEAFGGDPDCVTLLGESGGGLKISTLMAMPAAEGLFHRAIIQSGARVRHLDPEHSRRATAHLLGRLGVAESDAASLQAAPVDALVAAGGEANRALPGLGPGFPHPFTPTVDGAAVPCDPFDEVAPASSAKIPLLIGYNRTEATYFSRMGYGPNDPGLSREEALKRLAPVLAAQAEPLLSAFEEAFPGLSTFEHYIQLFTEFPTGAYSRHVGRLRSHAAATYMYRFDWMGARWGSVTGAPHMIELPFVFDAVDRGAEMVGHAHETAHLAAKVSAAWCAFARTGRPTLEGASDWPAFDTAAPRRMLIDHDAQVAPDLEPGLCRALARALDLPEE